jgi:hypothetical protein
MRWIRGFLAFWYDFVVGDDWTVAVGVAVALGATAVLTYLLHLPAWWLPPLAAVALLAASLRRAVTAARRG